MPILDQYIIQDSSGNFKFTDTGEAVIRLLRQRDDAVNKNRDYVLGWFKGMNIQPSSNTVLEFADELQEYVKFGSKRSVWDIDLYTNNLIKWNYYAQVSRPINPYALSIGLTVTNIVDDAMIEDRILKLDANTIGFATYGDRILSYTYTNIFTSSECTTLFGSAFDPASQLAREQVLAWFKGVNLQPSNEIIDAYKPYIQAYLLDPRKEIDSNIDIGIFLVK